MNYIRPVYFAIDCGFSLLRLIYYRIAVTWIDNNRYVDNRQRWDRLNQYDLYKTYFTPLWTQSLIEHLEALYQQELYEREYLSLQYQHIICWPNRRTEQQQL